MPEKIIPGVVVASKFVLPGAESYTGYIDYIDREEAIRNEAYHGYSAYVDGYMDNPEKQKQRNGFNAESDRTSAIFTATRDNLTAFEKSVLKDDFIRAELNGSPMWQDVLSFDNTWLEELGIYDQKTHYLDEQKIRDVTRIMMAEKLKQEDMENSAVWSADIHYNTDNIHVHIAVVEPIPTREKMLVKGREEHRGKVKQKTLDKMKSKVINNMTDRSKELDEINRFIRKEIVAGKQAIPSVDDVQLRQAFLNLYSKLPENQKDWQYNMNAMKPLRPALDAFTKKSIDAYFPKEFEALETKLDEQESFLRRAYGDGKRHLYQNYKRNKMQELYTRMGNQTLRELRQYDQALNRHQMEPLGMETEQIDALLNASVPEDGEEMPLEMDPIPVPLDAPATPESKTYEAQAPADLSADPTRMETLLLTDAPDKAEANISIVIDDAEMERLERKHPAPEIPVERYMPRPTSAGEYVEWSKKYKEAHKYLYGKNGLNKDIPRAYQLMRAEAALGNGYAVYDLARMIADGIGCQSDPDKAKALYLQAHSIFLAVLPIAKEKAARKKKTVRPDYLQYRVGKMYEYGLGVDQDYAKAAVWYQKSVSGNNAFAQYALGRLYYHGRGVEQDFKLAHKHYEQAASNDSMPNAYAMYELGKMYRDGVGCAKDSTVSDAWMHAALSAFLTIAQEKPDDNLYNRIGRMYYEGQGIPKDYGQAVYWLKAAADLDNPYAQYTLGNMYYTGEYVGQDYATALNYFARCVKNRDEPNPYALYKLGEMYRDGLGGQRNSLQSDAYFRAAFQGFERMAENTQDSSLYYRLGRMCFEGQGIPKDYGQAVYWLKAAADLDNPYAQYTLGRLYLQQGDTDNSRRYFSLAAAAGHEGAVWSLDHFVALSHNGSARLQSHVSLRAGLASLRRAMGAQLRQEAARNQKEYQQLLKQLNRTGRDYGREVEKGESYEEEL